MALSMFRDSPGALGTGLSEDKKISPFQPWIFLKSSLFFHRLLTHFPHRRALAVYQILRVTVGGEGRSLSLRRCAVHGLTHLLACAETNMQLGNVQVVFEQEERRHGCLLLCFFDFP